MTDLLPTEGFEKSRRIRQAYARAVLQVLGQGRIGIGDHHVHPTPMIAKVGHSTRIRLSITTQARIAPRTARLGQSRAMTTPIAHSRERRTTPCGAEHTHRLGDSFIIRRDDKHAQMTQRFASESRRQSSIGIAAPRRRTAVFLHFSLKVIVCHDSSISAVSA